ncbi:hypothetical protein [Yoonia sp.]|uniref:hypothetical protein n=1 Tax=Yoonia sp. TaxID=2212373 RepID=UPI002FDA559A
MNFFKTMAAAVAITSVATVSLAGGLSDQIMEAPVIVEEEVAAAGSSVDPAIIVLAILGLLVIGANLGGDEEERRGGTVTDPCNEEPVPEVCFF